MPCYSGGAIRYNRADLPRPPAPRAVPWNRQYRFARQVLSDSLDSCRWSPAAARRRSLRATPAGGPVIQPPLAVAYPFPVNCVPSVIPPLARRDLLVCAQRRRSHYHRIFESLQGLAGITLPLPDVDAETCPWRYPVLLADRAATDYKLRDLGVLIASFGEQLHPTLREIITGFPNAADLSRRLFFLPVHQRLSLAQVERFCATTTEFFSAAKDCRPRPSQHP